MDEGEIEEDNESHSHLALSLNKSCFTPVALVEGRNVLFFITCNLLLIY